MRRLLALLALLALAIPASGIAAASASSGASYHYNLTLRRWVHESLEVATYTGKNGKTIPLPVEVRCYTDRFSFEAGAYRRGDSARSIPEIIAYYDGGNTVHIRAGTCADALAFTRGIFTAETVGAFTTLLHESLHRQGFQNEHLTETFAIAAMYAAGRLVEYAKYNAKGATDLDAAWRATAPYGDKVLRIAFVQSNRMLAASYRTSWREVIAAVNLGWAARLRRQ
jgi:hypothetical protein